MSNRTKSRREIGAFKIFFAIFGGTKNWRISLLDMQPLLVSKDLTAASVGLMGTHNVGGDDVMVFDQHYAWWSRWLYCLEDEHHELITCTLL